MTGPSPAATSREVPPSVLHGLGFATALTALGLPPSAVPVALVLFNVVVELGPARLHRGRPRARPGLARTPSPHFITRRAWRTRSSRSGWVPSRLPRTSRKGCWADAQALRPSYWLRSACAWRNGSAETLSHPSNGPSISSMRNTALPTDSAQTKRAARTVAFRGAVNPKLVNVAVSQNRRTTRNGRGTDAPVPATTSHLVCNRASALSSARDWSDR